MKSLNLILLFLFTLQACVNNQGKLIGNQYFFIRHKIELANEITIDTVQAEMFTEMRDSIFNVEYLIENNAKKDTIKYRFEPSRYFNSELVINSKKYKELDFVFTSMRTYVINGKNFQIYKYAKNPLIIDGCEVHFWNPQIGVFITKSLVWKSYKKLQSRNSLENDLINLLSEILFQDYTFFNGCLEEQRLIPKSEYNEFYDWKYNDIDKIIF